MPSESLAEFVPSFELLALIVGPIHVEYREESREQPEHPAEQGPAPAEAEQAS